MSKKNEDMLDILALEYGTDKLSNIVGNEQTKLRCSETQKSGFNAFIELSATVSGKGISKCHTCKTWKSLYFVPNTSCF